MNNQLTRKEIENYFIDALSLQPSDFDDYSVTELVEILEDNGELTMCLDYNCKSN